jgi:hypothetical protein
MRSTFPLSGKLCLPNLKFYRLVVAVHTFTFTFTSTFTETSTAEASSDPQ